MHGRRTRRRLGGQYQILPAVVSGNTNAAVVAIAEKGADLVLAG